MNQTTLLLVGHGSREPSGNQEIEDFAQAWRAQRPQWRIEVCFIEFSATTLERGLDAAARGAQRVLVLHHGETISQGEPAKVVRDPAVIKSYLGTEVV